MRIKTILYMFLLLTGLSSFVVADDNATIRRQFVEYFAQQGVDDAEVLELVKTMQPDGTWADVNYKSTRGGSWETLVHLKRLKLLAMAYRTPESKLFKSPAIKDAEIRGLQHWLDKNYTNQNWWHMRIGIPQNMGHALVLMGDEIPPTMVEECCEVMLSRSSIDMTGQNKVWQSGVVFVRGLLTDTPSDMKAASESIWEELRVSTEEGIQPDWSFHQHGPQLQFGNYGRSYGTSMTMWLSILRGTEYAASKEKVAMLSNYLTDGVAWTLWKEQMDLNACGRQYSVEAAGYPPRNFRDTQSQIRTMISIDPENRDRYERLLGTSIPLVGHRSFWRSDFALHRRPDWYASVRMSSTRVIGTESCNYENIQGLLWGDGTMLLSLNGTEFSDIAPLWNWRRLPGITCDQGIKNICPTGYNKDYGGTPFAGVINDGTNGVAAMIFKRNELTARKAWFFEKDSVVCLGAGISDNTESSVLTSVQQSHLNGPVTLSAGTVSNGVNSLSKDAWVHHAGIGYHLMQPATLSIETVTGNWLSCFMTFSDRPVTGEVFSVWMDHGQSPTNQNYAYTIYPGITAGQMEQIIAEDQTTILSNTPKLQAVESEWGVDAVFYEVGTLVSGKGISITVDAPCLLSLRGDTLTINDPLHNRSEITVSLNGKAQTIQLPFGDETGKQVAVNMR